MGKKIHYNLDPLDKIGANFNLIISGRSDGKSYQLKHKKAIKKYLETGRRFILLRRLQEEIKSAYVEQYFADVDISGLTNGKYNTVSVYKGAIYLSVYNTETGRVRKVEKCGYVRALSTEQNTAGGSYLDVDDIIFEEFMSRTAYLPDEPNKLMNFYCTIDRKEGRVRLWLAGNTITRVCPYWKDWELQDLIAKQKQGTIMVKEIEVEKGTVVKLAVDYPEATKGTNFVIGTHSNMLNTGEWQTDPQPLLPKSKKKYKILYRIGFFYLGFRFLAEYLQDKEVKENCCWFVYPYQNKEFRDNILIFSDIVKIENNWQRDIYNTTFNNKKINNILEEFRETNLFFSDNLTGTDFKLAIDFNIRR